MEGDQGSGLDTVLKSLVVSRCERKSLSFLTPAPAFQMPVYLHNCAHCGCSHQSKWFVKYKRGGYTFERDNFALHALAA